MKRVLLLAVVCAVIGTTIGLVASIGQGGNPINPYTVRIEPDYTAVVRARIAQHPVEYKAIRKQVIDATDAPLLEILLSEGAMAAIWERLPINNWQDLYDLKYQAKPTSDPRRAVSRNTALMLLFHFDLPMGNKENLFPWQ